MAAEVGGGGEETVSAVFPLCAASVCRVKDRCNLEWGNLGTRLTTVGECGGVLDDGLEGTSKPCLCLYTVTVDSVQELPKFGSSCTL